MNKQKKKPFLQTTARALFAWLDVSLLVSGMGITSAGVFMIFRPAGWIFTGLCLMVLAFFVAKKQKSGE